MKTLLAPAHLLVRRGAFTLALAALSTLAAQAQQAPTVQVQHADAESIRVRIVQAPAGRVRVVSLGSGQTLFDEAYASTAYGHRLNFRQLRPGRYALLVEAGSSRYRYTVHLAAQEHGTVVSRLTAGKGELVSSAPVAALR